ncbi:MAG TPA: TetR family transcriptional regulator [Jiangellales bacterium]|nr:TetR family transcriptional regulator [Jiangellales bacterium]
MRSVDDLTARSRIRDAAIARFGTQGSRATTVREVATDAGVSPALVLHHFGSKEGLREACGQYVIDLMREKTSAAEVGDPAASMSAVESLMGEGMAVVRFLGRLVVEGGPHAELVTDELIRLTAEFLDHFEADGVVRPTVDPGMRAALLVSVRMGALLMPDHIARATGSDPLTPEGIVRVSRVLLELFTHGLFTDDRYLRAFEAAFAQPDRPPDTSPPVSPVDETTRPASPAQNLESA